MLSLAIVFYGINKIETVGQRTPPNDTDPRNPMARLNQKQQEHHWALNTPSRKP